LPHELATWISYEPKNLYCFNRSHLETGTDFQLNVNLASKPKSKTANKSLFSGAHRFETTSNNRFKLTTKKNQNASHHGFKLMVGINIKTWKVNLLSVEFPFGNALAPPRQRERIPSWFQNNGLNKIAKKLLSRLLSPQVQEKSEQLQNRKPI